MLTIQDKNTVLHLNGQNVRLAAKNGRNSKTPGLHLSATHGKEAVGRTMASPLTNEGTTQLNLLLLKSSQPDLDREAKNQPVRRPLKLAPLELSEEVKETQRQKLKFVQPEAKSASCKQNVTLNEPQICKVKSCVRQGLVKSAVCTSASTEPPKAQQQTRFSRPQLSRSNPTEQNADRRLKDVVCRGTPAPLCSKPAPLLFSTRVKAQVAHGRIVACQNPSIPQQQTGKRRLRLRRAQCLEDDLCNSNISKLSAEESILAKDVQDKGQQAERTPRGHLHPGKGIKETPVDYLEHGSVRKSHQENCSTQPPRCTLDQQSAEGGSNEHTLDSVKLSASNWRLKRKKPLITKHNNAVPLEPIQL